MPEGVKVSENLEERFRYLQNLKPGPCKFKQGDVCKVIKQSHPLFGQNVQVNYANGNLIEAHYKAKILYFKPEDLEWILHSQVVVGN